MQLYIFDNVMLWHQSKLHQNYKQTIKPCIKLKRCHYFHVSWNLPELVTSSTEVAQHLQNLVCNG